MSFVNVLRQQNTYVIRLSRPEKKNAFHPEMIAQLEQAFKGVDLDQDRLVLLEGEGDCFCAGADLDWMKSMKNYSYQENLDDSKNLFSMFQAGWQCPLPVIASLQGFVMGGANGLVALADVAIAESKTQFAFSEVLLGIAPAVISPFVLEKVPASWAYPLLLSGRRFSASEAQSAGLVLEVVETSEQKQGVQKWVDRFMRGGPKAVIETKKMIRASSLQRIQKAQQEVCQVISKLRVSDEGQEGLSAFFDQRKPQWLEQGQ